MFILSPFTTFSVAAAAALPPGHPYFPPGLGDIRSPCPALSTLANHGYLYVVFPPYVLLFDTSLHRNRNGKNITVAHLVAAVGEVFNIDPDTAVTFAQPAQDCCGTAGGIALNALAAHNKLEHDTSLAHADVLPGQQFASTRPDPILLSDFLRRGLLGGFSIRVLAQTRVDRERFLRTPLDPSFANGAAPLRAGLVWHVMKDPKTQVAPWDKVSTWFSEEKLPLAYQLPERITQETIGSLIGKVLAAIKEIRGN